MNERCRLVGLSVAADVVVIAASLALAFELHGLWRDAAWTLRPIVLLTSLLALAVTLLTFTAFGLYKYEVYVSRPLHLTTLFKGAVVALIIAASVTFFLREPFVTESRFVVSTVFALVFVFAAVVRIGVLDRGYRRAAAGGRATVVVGRSLESGVLVSRLKELRGYSRVKLLEPQRLERNGYDAEPGLLAFVGQLEPAPRQVFIDAGSVGHKAALDLVGAARERGAQAYVVGRLLGPLDSTRLLIHLFELPVMRVRHDPERDRLSPLKRGFDLVASAAALIVLSPLLLGIALAVKLDSPGSVLFRQERIGMGGRPFAFLKFRSMVVGNDPARHREYVERLIEGRAETHECGDGDEIFKLADDERVTRVGRFLRRYSLDELPQLLNVLKGEMSIVGPRPALGYEVEAYGDWHRLRLMAVPGISGVWQVAGRSRVSFDEMVFQDVMYAYNQSLLTDLSICLRTIPVVLQGRGAV